MFDWLKRLFGSEVDDGSAAADQEIVLLSAHRLEAIAERVASAPPAPEPEPPPPPPVLLLAPPNYRREFIGRFW